MPGPRRGMQPARSGAVRQVQGSCTEKPRDGLRRELGSLSQRSLVLCREDLIQSGVGEFIRSHKVAGKYSPSWPTVCNWPDQVILEPEGPTEIQFEGFGD